MHNNLNWYHTNLSIPLNHPTEPTPQETTSTAAEHNMSHFTAITLLGLVGAAEAATVLKCYSGSKTADSDSNWASITCNPSADGCYAVYRGAYKGTLLNFDATISGGCASKFIDSRTLCAQQSQLVANSENGKFFCGGKCSGDNCNDKLMNFDNPADNISSEFSGSTPTIIILFLVSVLLTLGVFVVVACVMLPKKRDK